jgi:hypothetical protein
MALVTLLILVFPVVNDGENWLHLTAHLDVLSCEVPIQIFCLF